MRLCQKRKRVAIVTLAGTESFVNKVGIDHNHIEWISSTVLMTLISSLIVNCLSIINLEVEVLRYYLLSICRFFLDFKIISLYKIIKIHQHFSYIGVSLLKERYSLIIRSMSGGFVFCSFYFMCVAFFFKVGGIVQMSYI